MSHVSAGETLSILVDLWHVASMILIYSPTGIEKATEAKAPRMRRSFISNLDRMRCVQCRSSLVEINSDVRRAPNAVTGAARMSECRVWSDAIIFSEEGTPERTCDRYFNGIEIPTVTVVLQLRLKGIRFVLIYKLHSKTMPRSQKKFLQEFIRDEMSIEYQTEVFTRGAASRWI